MKKLLYCLLVLSLTSCNLKEQEKTKKKTYFDLIAYFKKETIRLGKTNPTIDKTVIVNNKAENKRLKIKNWEQEFNSFTAADINKSSWRGSFKQQQTDSSVTYSSTSDKIPIKKLEIFYVNKKIAAIGIFITNTNDLYTSKDSLYYYPDSLYLIKKTQHISLMNEKKYQVSGKFK